MAGKFKIGDLIRDTVDDYYTHLITNKDEDFYYEDKERHGITFVDKYYELITDIFRK